MTIRLPFSRRHLVATATIAAGASILIGAGLAGGAELRSLTSSSRMNPFPLYEGTIAMWPTTTTMVEPTAPVVVATEFATIPNISPPTRLDLILEVATPGDADLSAAFDRCQSYGGTFIPAIDTSSPYLCQGVDY